VSEADFFAQPRSTPSFELLQLQLYNYNYYNNNYNYYYYANGPSREISQRHERRQADHLSFGVDLGQLKRLTSLIELPVNKRIKPHLSPLRRLQLTVTHQPVYCKQPVLSLITKLVSNESPPREFCCQLFERVQCTVKIANAKLAIANAKLAIANASDKSCAYFSLKTKNVCRPGSARTRGGLIAHPRSPSWIWARGREENERRDGRRNKKEGRRTETGERVKSRPTVISKTRRLGHNNAPVGG